MNSEMCNTEVMKACADVWSAAWKNYVSNIPLPNEYCSLCHCGIPVGTMVEHRRGIRHRFMVEARETVRLSRARARNDAAAETKHMNRLFETMKNI